MVLNNDGLLNATALTGRILTGVVQRKNRDNAYKTGKRVKQAKKKNKNKKTKWKEKRESETENRSFWYPRFPSSSRVSTGDQCSNNTRGIDVTSYRLRVYQHRQAAAHKIRDKRTPRCGAKFIQHFPLFSGQLTTLFFPLPFHSFALFFPFTFSRLSPIQLLPSVPSLTFHHSSSERFPQHAIRSRDAFVILIIHNYHYRIFIILFFVVVVQWAQHFHSQLMIPSFIFIEEKNKSWRKKIQTWYARTITHNLGLIKIQFAVYEPLCFLFISSLALPPAKELVVW